MRFIMFVMLSLMTSYGQAKHKGEATHFELGKPIPEPLIVACRTEAAAVDLVKLTIADKDSEAQALYTMLTSTRVCGSGSAVVTYIRRVFEGERDGQYHAVYEATLQGANFRIYVPMIGFVHAEKNES